MRILLNEGQFDRIFITENRESKNMSLARDVVRNLSPYRDPMQVVNVLRNDIPSSRLNHCFYLPGVARMYLTNQIRDGETVSKLNATLKILASAHADEYDHDLNGLSSQELIDRFATAVRADIENKKRANAGIGYGGTTDYDIVKISSFDDASKYQNYVTWCVCHYPNMYDSYTHDGMGVFYFLLKKGFEGVQEVVGEGCPLDEYGLSMVAVSVNEDGSLNTVTCRWNHDNGGNDHIMDDRQVSELLGADVYQVLKPLDIKVLFEDDRFKILSNEGKNVLYDKEHGYYANFNEYGYAAFGGNDNGVIRYGMIGLDGKIMLKPKYTHIGRVESDGCMMVHYKGQGLVTADGLEVIKCGSVDSISKATPLGTRVIRIFGMPSVLSFINVKLGKKLKNSDFSFILPSSDTPPYSDGDLGADGNFLIQCFDKSNALVSETLDVIALPNKPYYRIGHCYWFKDRYIRLVTTFNGMFGAIDKDGKEIVPCMYNSRKACIDAIEKKLGDAINE